MNKVNKSIGINKNIEPIKNITIICSGKPNNCPNSKCPFFGQDPSEYHTLDWCNLPDNFIRANGLKININAEI